jgi:HEAT repeat protein
VKPAFAGAIAVSLALGLVGLAAPGDAWAGKLRRYEKATAKADAKKLARGLKYRRSYVRERAAQGLAQVAPTDRGTRRLLTCVDDGDERDWVRSACASTLATWQVPDAVPVIAGALGEVGAESRYWMGEALHRLGGDEARAAITGLASDPDLFVSTAAREWSR